MPVEFVIRIYFLESPVKEFVLSISVWLKRVVRDACDVHLAASWAL